VRVCAHFDCALLVEGLEGAGQQQHRNALQRGIALELGAERVAVQARHADIGEDDVGLDLTGANERVVAVVDGDELDVLVGERDPDDLLDRHTVVGQKQGLRHVRPNLHMASADTRTAASFLSERAHARLNRIVAFGFPARGVHPGSLSKLLSPLPFLAAPVQERQLLAGVGRRSPPAGGGSRASSP
jgi:hypothetical protein